MSSLSLLPAAALGFVGTAALLGPVAQAQIGKQVNQWWIEIGTLGRVVIIALFGTGVLVLLSVEPGSVDLIRHIEAGVLSFAVLAMIVHIIRAE